MAENWRMTWTNSRKNFLCFERWSFTAKKITLLRLLFQNSLYTFRFTSFLFWYYTFLPIYFSGRWETKNLFICNLLLFLELLSHDQTETCVSHSTLARVWIQFARGHLKSSKATRRRGWKEGWSNHPLKYYRNKRQIFFSRELLIISPLYICASTLAL